MQHTAPGFVERVIGPKLRLESVPSAVAEGITANTRDGAVTAMTPRTSCVRSAGRRLELVAMGIGRALVGNHPLLPDNGVIDGVGIEKVLPVLLIERLLLHERQNLDRPRRVTWRAVVACLHASRRKHKLHIVMVVERNS